jgi:uncharacterized membrane protein YhaH (DUF805 family)
MRDKRIRQEILEQLETEPGVDVAVKRGVVTLRGHVPNNAEDAQVVTIVRHVKGVRAVTDWVDIAMTFGQAIKSGFSHYIKFSGRAIPSEYWFWVLFAVLGMIATWTLDGVIFVHYAGERLPGELVPGLSPLYSPFNFIFIALLLLPSIAVAVRRLHDIDLSGWWMLLVFSGIGIVVLLYLQTLPGSPCANRFGPDPCAHLRECNHG